MKNKSIKNKDQKQKIKKSRLSELAERKEAIKAHREIIFGDYQDEPV